MKKIKYVGIDPGADGGIAIIDDCSRLVDVISLKNTLQSYESTGTISTFFGINLQNTDEAPIFMEQNHARPSDARRAAFSFGRNTGKIEGFLYASQGVGPIEEIQYVPPQTWKKEFDLIGKDKQASIETVKQLFPLANLTRTKRSKQESDGMAEAILIAEYGRRQCQK